MTDDPFKLSANIANALNVSIHTIIDQAEADIEEAIERLDDEDYEALQSLKGNPAFQACLLRDLQDRIRASAALLAKVALASAGVVSPPSEDR